MKLTPGDMDIIRKACTETGRRVVIDPVSLCGVERLLQEALSLWETRLAEDAQLSTKLPRGSHLVSGHATTEQVLMSAQMLLERVRTAETGGSGQETHESLDCKGILYATWAEVADALDLYYEGNSPHAVVARDAPDVHRLIRHKCGLVFVAPDTA